MFVRMFLSLSLLYNVLEFLEYINQQKALEAAESSEWKSGRIQAKRKADAEAGKHSEIPKPHKFSWTS